MESQEKKERKGDEIHSKEIPQYINQLINSYIFEICQNDKI